jgi:acetyl-CoA synthetase
MLMKTGTELARKYDLTSLRFLGSVGEPLNPEAVVWGLEAFGQPFHDNWWQTETGGIMIANFASMDIRPGSMGRPVPGVEAAIVRRTKDGDVAVIEEPDQQGELALRPGWPSMCRGYLREPERYAKCFAAARVNFSRHWNDGYRSRRACDAPGDRDSRVEGAGRGRAGSRHGVDAPRRAIA